MAAGRGRKATLIVGGGVSWYLIHDRRPKPSVLLARALECLDERDNLDAIGEARRLASDLHDLKYRDPDFVGAVPYILGIVEFRRARRQGDQNGLDAYPVRNDSP